MSTADTLLNNNLSVLLRAGSHEAFTKIYSSYWKKLLLIAWNHTQDKLAAEDLVHEVFMSLWENKGQLNIENIEAYLVTAIKFSIFKKHRRELRRSELAAQNYHFTEVEAGDEKLDALFLKEYIDGLIEHLPDRCKLVFKYSRELGMQNAAIAQELNISEKAVEANITRALKIVRGGLESSGLIILIAKSIYNNFL
jgi:RNA polymerase sigma-70 factor (family 1)